MGKKKTKKSTDLDMQAQIDPAPESAMNAVMDAVASSPKDPFPVANLEMPEPIVAIDESAALIRAMVENAFVQESDNEFFRHMKRRRDKERV